MFRQMRMMLRLQRIMLAIVVPSKPENKVASTIAQHGQQLAYLQQQTVQANSQLIALTVNGQANYQTLLTHAQQLKTIPANHAYLSTISQGSSGTTIGYTFPGTYDGGVGEQALLTAYNALVTGLAAANIVV